MIFLNPLILIACLLFLSSSINLRYQSPLHQSYKDNLIANNWYYGDIKPLEYRNRIFDVASN